MNQRPVHEWNSREVMLRRAAYLFIGIAIGLFMLGFLQMAKRSENNSQTSIPSGTQPKMLPSPQMPSQ